MAKRYTFEFVGTKETFLKQLNKYPNNNQKFFYFDDYIVDVSDGDLRFGVARGGHSGGYWYIPTMTEVEGKITFEGKIEYISLYTSEKGIKRLINKIDEALLGIFLFPVIVIIKVYLFFSWLVRKICKNPKPKEETDEDRLYKLMENHLNCTRR